MGFTLWRRLRLNISRRRVVLLDSGGLRSRAPGTSGRTIDAYVSRRGLAILELGQAGAAVGTCYWPNSVGAYLSGLPDKV